MYYYSLLRRIRVSKKLFCKLWIAGKGQTTSCKDVQRKNAGVNLGASCITVSQQGLQDARRNATHCQVHGVTVAKCVRRDRNRKCYAVTPCPCHCGVYPVQRCLSRCYVPHWLMFDPLFPGRQVFPHTQCVSGIQNRNQPYSRLRWFSVSRIRV